MSKEISLKQIRLKRFEFCRKVLFQHGLGFIDKDIISPNRTQEIVLIRALIVYILLRLKYEFPEIGEIINRDRTAAYFLSGYSRKSHNSEKFKAITSKLSISMYFENKLKEEAKEVKKERIHKEILLYKLKIIELELKLKAQ